MLLRPDISRVSDKSAVLALTMLDWREFGSEYAKAMVELSQSLATALAAKGMPLFGADQGFTRSHQFAIEAKGFGGGQAASKTLRKAGFLACGIGLPIDPVEGDLNGLRIGTPELVRWGVRPSDAERMAELITRGLAANRHENLAMEVAEWRSEFSDLHFIRQ